MLELIAIAGWLLFVCMGIAFWMQCGRVTALEEQVEQMSRGYYVGLDR